MIERALEGDAPRTQRMAAFQPRKRRRMRWKRWSYVCRFDFGDVAPVDLLDLGMVGNQWRGMQVR
jgi:hypothetical protein